jgi:hypothetical protein
MCNIYGLATHQTVEYNKYIRNRKHGTATKGPTPLNHGIKGNGLVEIGF